MAATIRWIQPTFHGKPVECSYTARVDADRLQHWYADNVKAITTACGVPAMRPFGFKLETRTGR